MEPPQQPQMQQQPGSESPDWLARLPDLGADDTWLRDFAADSLADPVDNSYGEVDRLAGVKAEADEAGAGGRQTRKRQRPAADGADDGAFDSDVDEEAEEGGGKRGARRKGAAAKEQKKLNEKARRQRENDFIVQLAKLLDPARAGRADKLSTLADAVKEITRLRTDTAALQRLNKVLEERVADLKARQQYTQGMAPPMPPPPMFMQQMQQMAQQQLQLQQPQQQQPQPQPQSQPQVVSQPEASQLQTQPQPQMQIQIQPQQPAFGNGMVALPAAAFQQMLAAHQARMEAAAKAAAAAGADHGSAAPGVQQAPLAAFKAPGGGDVLSSAACLYMPSSQLDVSADSVKRPPAA